MSRIKISLPQAIVAAVAIAAFAAVYVLAPDDRDTIEKAVLGVWAFVSTFLAPLLGKHAHDNDDGDDA